ncbi:hypothetical protein [Streptomyces cucumeris]|uniref:hypothetical protein n=1 Tax=Streptomyces cucumeris TaxID=2962890 RepID=UPI0020C8429E|nr:hypothetical protein [Streptomyces sp. NEAU-Y11]MCP9209552.1 hypothetical protein [Streptomyces sp. NEAU-Y11]
MRKYPMGRWSPSDTSIGAMVWTRHVPEGEGGGYYLYSWQRGALQATVEELIEGTTKREREQQGKRSRYVQVDSVSIPAEVAALDKAGQELGVARMLYADMRERFGGIAEWVTYDTAGRPVWFHDRVINEG